MGQQQSGFVVEIASPRLGRFQALPQKDPDEEDRASPPPREWRITANPSAELFGTDRLRAVVHRLYHQRKILVDTDVRLLHAALFALDPAAELLLPLLTVISNATAHHANQELLREFRITDRIADMVNIRGGWTRASRVMLLQCLANMAVAKENHTILSRCVPQIIYRLNSTDAMESSVAMQALTNLSLNINPSQTEQYAKCIPLCLSRLWVRGEPSLDALRLLVNLSCCPDLVPHILGSKNISGILCILDSDKYEVLVRAVTWILCMTSAVDALHITYDKLSQYNLDPFGNPSHTLYHGIYGFKAREHLEKRAEELTRHPQRDVANKAKSLIDILGQIEHPPAVGFHLNRL